ncbi:MAG: hypothetical protein ACXW5U_26055 [Thermoanaerobaculia bacterium]
MVARVVPAKPQGTTVAAGSRNVASFARTSPSPLPKRRYSNQAVTSTRT